ncbi:BRD4-interacting chromatin-remodeling complex-associated protein isoform X2 [Brienomyrus brachyistius]|uniref:BRD4-interacting chromatin-remodeling complex-associated protein isoform X2 n=1 Tax=Brienomyrus brachyistius TaxID=42636 RepID=UPI0020B3DD80|nr:BRD4-interacting chromatin-remodeling complex-associated protein isoform X2 [Brienomyrus brachyistius]
MEDEDGTCLLDVLCDPQALNDFLHGTNELEGDDLLINSSPGEPSLFADAPSPGSLLADDVPSRDTPPPGCVDLSFLEEALLSSPDGVPEVGQGGPVGVVEEEEEACDILQQSLQEADITEQTLALEAGLAAPGDALSLYNPPGTLIGSLASQFLPKTSPLPTMPRDTQAAVEPPQPSLLAVGPGCPSLKPAAPQLMGLLPGTVFPATPPEASISLSPAQGSGMIIQKALPSLTGRPMMATSLRATTGPGILLTRGPLPIQPKMPVNIQPRLVQISPKPSGQKNSPSLTLVQGTASPNILLSPPLGPKQPPATPHLSKPVSVQLLNQGGSIVIQPQGLFQGHNQFLLPNQTPVTVPQSAGATRPLLTPASQQEVSVRGRAPSSGHLMDSTQILTAPPRQLNFSPVFTTPTGQLALRQGALLSAPLHLQSAPPTIVQMPAQVAGSYTPQGQAQRGSLLHGTALGGHITLINSPGMLPSDVASISIVNGPSVVQGLPFPPQTQQPISGGVDGQQSQPQTSVLLLPETSALEDKGSNEEQLLHVPRVCPTEVQSSPPVLTVLQPQLDIPLHHDPVNPLPEHILPRANGSQVLDRLPSPAPSKHDFMHRLQQVNQQSLQPQATSAENLPVTLQVQVTPRISAQAAQRETSTPSQLTVSQAGAPPVTPNPRGIGTSTHPGHEQLGPRCSPLIGQASLSTTPAGFSSPFAGQAESLSESRHGKAPHFSQATTPVHTVPSPLVVGLSVGPHSPTRLLGSEDPQAPTDPPTQLRAQVSEYRWTVKSNCQANIKYQRRRINRCHLYADLFYSPEQALVSAVQSRGSPLCPDPASPKIQGPQIQGQHSLKHHSQVTQTEQHSNTQVTTCNDKEREERLSPAMRKHRFQQLLCRDHAAVLSPDAHSPFLSLENAVIRLLPYHTCAGCLPSQTDFLTDKQFEAVSGLLLKRTKEMLNKYRQLLLGEAQQVSPSAEMVMLERLFLQAERGVLGEEKRKARLEPESFLVSLRKPASGPPLLHSNSPPSPPSWALLSDRPPGLKTYRSSSRGALKLTIKHESGSRKVVHNSACESTGSPPSSHKQDCTGQLTNGRDTINRQGQGGQDPTYPQNQTESSDNNRSQVTGEAQESKQITDTHAAYSHSQVDPQSSASVPPSTDPILCPPKPKRLRPDPDQDQQGLAFPGEDHVLNEHLQSAIDSILELQRMQGPPRLQTQPPPDSKGASALEQAVSSIMEGHR